jgi:hypothetical protein
MRNRRAEKSHDAVAQNLIHGLQSDEPPHHDLQSGPGSAHSSDQSLDQARGAFDVGKEDGHLFRSPPSRCAKPDLLGKMR